MAIYITQSVSNSTTNNSNNPITATSISYQQAMQSEGLQAQAQQNYYTQMQNAQAQYNYNGIQHTFPPIDYYAIYMDKERLENYLQPLSLFQRAEYFIYLKFYNPILGYAADKEWEKWNRILEKKKHDAEFNNDLKDMLEE